MQELVDSLEKIIQTKVNEAKESILKENLQYAELVSELLNECRNAQEYYDFVKADGLTFSTVEAEGFLRAMILVQKNIQYLCPQAI
jgi:hypothetical protein